MFETGFSLFPGFLQIKTWAAVGLNLLTLNMWGLPDRGFVRLSFARHERMGVLCEELKAQAAKPEGYDIVLLQEMWMEEDRLRLRDCGYRYVADEEEVGADLDSGLITLSRLPITAVDRVIYRHQGNPRTVTKDGEALVRKSVLFARVQSEKMGDVWVANTHLVAVHDMQNDYYESLRVQQFSELAAAVRAKQKSSIAMIIGGDMNSGPGYRIWANFQKWFQDFSESSNGTLRPGEVQCTKCPPNSFSTLDEGKLDHLLSLTVGAHALYPVASTRTAETTFQARGRDIHVSDHFGWATRFERSAPADQSPSLPSHRLRSRRF